GLWSSTNGWTSNDAVAWAEGQNLSAHVQMDGTTQGRVRVGNNWTSTSTPSVAKPASGADKFVVGAAYAANSGTERTTGQIRWAYLTLRYLSIDYQDALAANFDSPNSLFEGEGSAEVVTERLGLNTF